MLPDRVSNPGPLTYESDALPIALRGPAVCIRTSSFYSYLSVETFCVNYVKYTCGRHVT